MSLYRQATGPSARVAILAALAALVVGGLVGFLIGRETASEPTLEELVADAREDLRPALGALELVGIEYAEAVRGREIVAETEYDAAVAQAQTARDVLDQAEALATLYPDEMRDARAAVLSVDRAVEQQAESERVAELVRDARQAVGEIEDAAASTG
jgi:hypothetical protein